MCRESYEIFEFQLEISTLLMKGRLSKRKERLNNSDYQEGGLCHKKSGITRQLVFCLLIFSICLVKVNTVDAKSPKKSDYLNLGLYGGYSTLLGQSSNMIVPGSLGAGVHIGYEYREGQVWIGGGGEFSYLSSTCKSDITIDNLHFQDTRLTNAIMKYTMLSPRQEMQNMGVAKLYLMAGYCTGTHIKDGFYFGGGFKVGSKFDLYNTSTVSYETQAEYDRYIEDYQDMPNHYYTTNTITDTVAFGTKLYVSLIAEGGWDMKLGRCNRLKLALFAEAGLTNIMSGVTTRKPSVNPDNVFEVTPYSCYNDEEMQNHYVVPLTVGVRLSFMINVSRLHSRCHTCPCYRKKG